jgi:hypothetical protein
MTQDRRSGRILIHLTEGSQGYPQGIKHQARRVIQIFMLSLLLSWCDQQCPKLRISFGSVKGDISTICEGSLLLTLTLKRPEELVLCFRQSVVTRYCIWEKTTCPLCDPRKGDNDTQVRR